MSSSIDPDPERYSLVCPGPLLASTSWVNFLEVLDITPQEENLFDMEFVPGLHGDRVPMRWRGQDLLALSSLLGFQIEARIKADITKRPMPLPVIWNGPLGSLHFENGADGCKVEFAERVTPTDTFEPRFHDHYRSSPKKCRPFDLRSRLCYSMGSFRVKSDGKEQVLYLAVDSEEENNDDVDDGNWVEFSDQDMEILKPRPGLISRYVEEARAVNLGLNRKTFVEYGRSPITGYRVKATSRYRLGKYFMDKIALKLFKESLPFLKPDGFYPSPSRSNESRSRNMYSHVLEFMKGSSKLLPRADSKFWMRLEELRWAAELCNTFSNHTRVRPSIQDIRVLSHMSTSLEDSLGSTGKELYWAFIVSPDLFSHFAEMLSKMKDDDPELEMLLKSSIAITAKPQDDQNEVERGVLRIINSPEGSTNRESGNSLTQEDKTESCHEFALPLFEWGKYTGVQLIAALLDIYLTALWILKSWPTNLNWYIYGMPRNVLMF